MKKQAIALAVAAAMTAPVAAMADATLYGVAHVAIQKLDNDSANNDNYDLGDSGSRIGVKGSEDLGNGLKAIYQFEMVYDIDEGAGVAGARNSFVGLSGDWGTVLAGRHDTPAKWALYGTGVETMGDTVIQFTPSGSSNGPAGMLNMQETRADDAVAYISPNFAGLTIALATVPGEGNEANGNNGMADAYSVGMIYKNAGIKFGAGYENLDDLGGTDTGASLWNVGGSYTFDALTLGVLYQQQDAALGDNESKMFGVSGSYKFGNNAVHLKWGNTKNNYDLVTGGPREGNAWGLGLTHNFSKRTQLYAAYANKTVKDSDQSIYSVYGTEFNEGDQIAIGVFHKF